MSNIENSSSKELENLRVKEKGLGFFRSDWTLQTLPILENVASTLGILAGVREHLLLSVRGATTSFRYLGSLSI